MGRGFIGRLQTALSLQFTHKSNAFSVLDTCTVICSCLAVTQSSSCQHSLAVFKNTLDLCHFALQI